MRILHLFNWNLKDIVLELEMISAQGFNAIQINPIQPSKDEECNKWWMCYQPVDFTIGNKYGNKKDLIYLCNIAKFYNIDIIADVVINHVAGADDGSLVPHYKVNNNLKNKDFYKRLIPIHNWDNRDEVINNSLGLPSLNLNNKDVQKIIFKFLDELIMCGVKGIRFDAAKSIALPHEGCDFWEVVTAYLEKHNIYCYGEVIFEKLETLFQYTTYIDVLTENNTINTNNTIHFIESHDSYLEFCYTNHMDENHINDLYNNLAKEHSKTIYYSRPFSHAWKSPIIRDAHYSKGYTRKKIS